MNYFNSEFKKKNKYIKAAGLTALMTVFLSACSFPTMDNKPVSKVTSSNSVEIQSVSPKNETISAEIVGLAQYKAAKNTGVFYRYISGSLKRTMVQMGDSVKIGQPLMEINIPDFLEKLANKQTILNQWSLKNRQLNENIENARRQINFSNRNLWLQM